MITQRHFVPAPNRHAQTNRRASVRAGGTRIMHPKIGRSALVLALLSMTVGSVRAAFPNFTNLLIGELTACAPVARNNVDCLVPLGIGLQRMQSLVQDVHDIGDSLQTISSAASTVDGILSILQPIPIIGQVVTPFAAAFGVVKTGVGVASDVVGTIDDTLWPFEPSLSTALSVVSQAKSLLNTTAQFCVSSSASVSRARNSLAALSTGLPITRSLTASMETFSSAVQPPARLAVQVMSVTGSACATIRLIVSRTLPNTTSIKSGIDKLLSYLNPIVEKLDSLWKKQFCLSLFKVAKNDKDVEAIADLVAKRKITVRSEDGAEITDIMLLKGTTRALQRFELCFSLQNIASVVSMLPNSFKGQITRLLNSTMSGLLSLPGLPNINSLTNFVLGFDARSLNLGFDFPLIKRLVSAQFKCPLAILQACQSGRPLTPAVQSACAKPLR